LGQTSARQEKDPSLTQFQQFILIVMTKKKTAGHTRVDIITRVYVAEYAKFHCISLILTALLAVVA
jgi:hypothetical protein